MTKCVLSACFDDDVCPVVVGLLHQFRDVESGRRHDGGVFIADV
ncbi:hypothetical protein [Idiomarina abyssalis]